MLGPEFIRLLGGVGPQGPHSDLGQHQGHDDIYTVHILLLCGGELGEEEARQREEKKEAKSELF